MATKQNLRDNLYKALGLFIEAIRPYIVLVLQEEAGADRWDNWYVESLYPDQQDHWLRAVENGSNPEILIDFNNLKGFALKYRDLLRDDFDKKVNSLPTWFEEINEVRNKCYHHQEMSDEEVQRAFSNMVLILRMLEMEEVEQAVTALKENKRPAEAKKEKQAAREPAASYGMMPWFKNVEPHLDIKQGRLDESVFAANLGEVALRSGREIYQNPAIFFEKTYFTAGLKTVSRRVIQGLNGGQDAENRVISLETGFGGGKTHTLISLYHLADMGKTAIDSKHTAELIEYTGEPEFDKANVAVFTNSTNDPTQGREEDGLHIRTIWGELAYQLGGKEAYEIVRANDENRTAPKGLFKKVIEKTKPALILIDELADYCVSASGAKVGDSNLSDQTMSFVQELTEAIAGTDRCVAVVTLPASATEVGGTEEAARILNVLSNRLKRIGVDAQPVADEEIFEVIRRRLFEDLGEPEVIEQAASQYMQLYRELGRELPSYAGKIGYKNQLMKSYPFHPELINMFRVRWASHHDFQRTRGVLRVLASIVSDLWKRQGSLTGSQALIHTSDVNFANLDALTGELKRLYGTGYEAVIAADVAGGASNSFKIDQDKPEYGQYNLTQGICSTVLLGSFGRSGSNQGISIEEIKLCVMKPQTFNHNSVNGALDALESTAHHLYYSSTGSTTKHYWFYTKPNMNILINQTRGEIQDKEIESEILDRIQQREGGVHLFKVLINPGGDVPEQKKPSLVILGPEYQVGNGELTSHIKKKIEQIATKKGNSDRIYRNTILFLTCTELGYSKLSEVLKEYLACYRVREEYKERLDAEQKQDLKKRLDETGQKIDQALVSAYTIIIKYSAREGFRQLQIRSFKDRMDYQINANVIERLKEEEWLLEGIGITTLKKHNLYPTVEEPVQIQSIYEAFLRYDDKPMITGVDAIQNSLLRYCQNGEFAIAAGSPGDFTQMFYKQAPAFFDVTDETYWLVDRSQYKEVEVPLDEDLDKPKPGGGVESDGTDGATGEMEEEDVQVFKSITISGKVDIANYHQVFTSFINPLKNHKVEIQIKVKGKSTETHPLTEKSDAYKIAKESAKQLGLDFDGEE